MAAKGWTVRSRPATKSDLAGIVAWYQREAPEQVGRFRAEYDAAIETIASRPYLFPQRIGLVRCHTLRVFPYSVWYVAEESTRTVHVLAVLHVRRDPTVAAARAA